MDRGPPEPWEAFADAVLRGEALLCRVGHGIPPRDFAGLFVDDAEIDRILSELPGLDGPTREAAEAMAAPLSSRLEELRRAFRASLSGESPFAALVSHAGLASEEAEVLAVLVAVELDPRRQRLVAYIQDSVHLPVLDLSTIRRLFPPPHAGGLATSPSERMARAELIDVEATGPWATRMVSVPRRVIWFLLGDGAPDPDLPVGAVFVETNGRGDGAPLVLSVGKDRATRLRNAFDRCGGPRFVVAPCPDGPEGWGALVREATLTDAGIALEVEKDLPPEARQRIRSADHLAWAICSPAELALESLPERAWVEVRTTEEIATDDDWFVVTGSRDPPPHPLGREQLRLVGLALEGLGGDLDSAIKRLASGHLDRLATQVRPSRSWLDLVLPPDQSEQLRELAARYRHRRTVYDRWGFQATPSAGLVALFAGPSGTGKTLAAEVVAGDLGLDLYKIDLSSVVSKYIGETEKNLESIFTAASAGNLVLFFDEADALFGKRSEVSDAHDRYANIEVAYLLQRLETYEGMVIMATNLQRNLDTAFLRRIHLAVEFPMPDEEARRAIWELSIPPSAPAGDLDIPFLARQFKISGGSIRGAALTAAFIAAEGDTAITMETVMLGLKREFQKLGRLRTEAEFDRYFGLVKEDSDVASVG
jgi:ATPase family associated with various cellular activities (AAA)/Winged helix domain, variant